MTRISDNYMLGMLQFGMARNREKIARHTEEISSGYRAQNPSDTSQPGLIDQFREKVGRMQGHLERIQGVLGNLDYQEQVLGESENVVQRALELAAQGASETYSVESRASMAKEVFGLRDQLVILGEGLMIRLPLSNRGLFRLVQPLKLGAMKIQQLVLRVKDTSTTRQSVP
jgi:flagellar hook-associated protein 3 FlgL